MQITNGWNFLYWLSWAAHTIPVLSCALDGDNGKTKKNKLIKQEMLSLHSSILGLKKLVYLNLSNNVVI